MSVQINRDEWLKALGDAVPPEDDPEALSTLEFAEMFGCSRAAASRRLTDLEKAGKVRRVSKSIPRSSGGLMRVPAYRLTQTTAKAKKA